MKLNPRPKVTELTDDQLQSRLSALETRYGMSSRTFLQRFNSGELGDSREFIHWAGLLDIACEAGIVAPCQTRATSA